MLQILRDRLIEEITSVLSQWDCDEVAVADTIEINEYGDEEKGQLATPIAYQLAVELGRSPADIANDIADALQNRGHIEGIETINTVAGYINFHVDEDEFATRTLESILETEQAYGSIEGETTNQALFEFSSPNIAKPLHIGHLRNTILGDVLGAVLETRGYDLVRDNHIGDWGVQFGQLLYQFEEYGDEAAFEANPIEYLLDLYQRYGRQEAKLDAEGRDDELEMLRETGRKYFASLEDGDEKLTARWERFREESLARFETTYDRLDVTFDTWAGESFYVTESWTDYVLDKAQEQNITVEAANGAHIIPIYDSDVENVADPDSSDVRETPPNRDDEAEYKEFVISKSDGTTTYGTRDLATVAYRVEELGLTNLFYVVGNEQREYFEQMFAAARKLGYTDVQFTHIDYGLISLPEGNMSTREGRLITVDEVLDRIYKNAIGVVREANPELDEKTTGDIAEGVTIGTVRFENIARRRNKDTVFDIEQATSLQGDTGPYIQYAATRGINILQDADSEISELDGAADQPFNEYDYQLAFQLARYPFALERCEDRCDPAPLAQYLLDLARTFNKFYHENRVLDSAQTRDRRLMLVAATVQLFETAFEITGIPVLQRM